MDKYCTIEDVELAGGLSNKDFMQGGHVMSQEEYVAFMDKSIQWCSQVINRYCNVKTFNLHNVTEYHNGRYNGFDEPEYQYDTDYFLKEFPCHSIGNVWVDRVQSNAPATFVLQPMRTDTTAGNYIAYIENELGCIHFVSHYPPVGHHNIKIEYVAGYPDDSQQLQEIRFICTRIMQNYQLFKKKVQEVATVRNTNIADYSPFYSIGISEELLTPQIRTELDRYRMLRFTNLGGFS